LSRCPSGQFRRSPCRESRRPRHQKGDLSPESPTGNVSEGRIARLQRSPREGPESAPKPPFNCEPKWASPPFCDLRRTAHRRSAGEVPVPRVSDCLRPEQSYTASDQSFSSGGASRVGEPRLIGSLIVRKNHAVRGTQSRPSTVVLCSICYQLIN